MVQREIPKEREAPSCLSAQEIEALFYRLRWPPNGDPRCPQCGSEARYEIQCRSYRNGALWRCANPPCRHDFSLLSGTLLAHGKTELRTYYAAIDAFAHRTTWKCARHMGRVSGMNYKACYILARKLFSLLSHEGERIGTEELLGRVLRAKPQPEHWKKYHPVTAWPPPSRA